MENILKKIYNKIYSLLYSSSSKKASSIEESFIFELRNEVKKIKIINTENLSGSELEWTDNMNEIRDLILNSNPREFLSWDVIKYTMFVVRENYVQIELSAIRKSNFYENIWKTALLESNVGRPLRYWRFPKSSGNLIHHVYHLSRYREMVNVVLEDLDLVIEFGGGYGSMCRALHNCKFNKKYVIFDLPVFSALQKFYLKNLGLRVLDSHDYISAESGVICISSFEELAEIISKYSNCHSKLFLATWSLSETPLNFRKKFIPLIDSFEYYLIAYQSMFNEVDNKDFFRSLSQSVSSVKWNDFEIEHLHESHYLFGEKI